MAALLPMWITTGLIGAFLSAAVYMWIRSALAGAGLPGGRIFGKTCPAGAKVIADPVTVPDLLATVCTVLGIDPREEIISPDGRPIKVVDKGKVIKKLLS